MALFFAEYTYMIPDLINTTGETCKFDYEFVTKEYGSNSFLYVAFKSIVLDCLPFNRRNENWTEYDTGRPQ